MGIIKLICFIIGILSVCYFVGFILKKIKGVIKNDKPDFISQFPYNYYREKPLVFLIGGLVIMLITVFTIMPSIMNFLFPNSLQYKPEGVYCYYVKDKNNNAYPAQIEKKSYDESDGEDFYGNSKTSTYVYVDLLKLYVDNEVYDFTDDPQEINTNNYSTISYYYEIESNNTDEGLYNEKMLKLKLTNDVAYCPSFGKGNMKIDYFELILEIVIIVSEFFLYIITIYIGTKENKSKNIRGE